jgi:Fe-S-cluster containining protein
MSQVTDNQQPWYRDGLRFRCTQCGDCCTGSPGFVWVDNDEIAAIATHLDKPVGEVRLLQTRPAGGRVSLREHPNGDCVFLDPHTRKCSVYQVRPKQCRTWPFWRSNIESPEAWERTKRTCPGAGCGDLVPLHQIVDLVGAIEL